MGTLKNPVNVMKRALRSMSKAESRPILCAAHLDECGDVVATDSYRLSIEHGAWEGPSMDIDLATAYDIAHHKGRCKSATIEVDGTAAKVTMDDGTVIDGRIREGKYPNYKQLMPEYATGITVGRNELLEVARELVKAKSDMLIDTDGRHARVTSSQGKCEASFLFEECAVGAATMIRLNSTYVRDALNCISGKTVEIRLTSPTKPAVVAEGDLSTGSKVGFRSFETLVMPVRLNSDEERKARKKGMRTAPKSPEPEIKAEVGSLEGERVCITGSLPTITRSEAFSRLKLAGGVPCEKFTSKVTMFVIAADAGRDKRAKAERAIAKGQKVRVVNGTEFVKALMEQGKTAGERKQEEHMAKKKAKVEKVNVEGLAELLYALAIDRAAKEPDNRLTEGNASPNSATYMWRLQKEGRLKHEDFGNYTSWYLDGDFVTCIERRYSTRKIHLHYPEIKPAFHKDDVVMKRRTEQKLAEHGAEAEVDVAKVDDGITAVTIEPPKNAPKPEKKQPPKAPAKPKATEKKEDTLEKRIEELEKQLKATRKELEEVWKENEHLKAKGKAAEPKRAEAGKPADKVAEVSLKSMEGWCEGKGLVASQKREGTCIWVEGDSKEYADELKQMGFRFAKKRKSWYYNPAA